MDIYWVKEQVVKGNYQFKLHALERASTRGIDPIEIKEALLSGKIIGIILKINEDIVVLCRERR